MALLAQEKTLASLITEDPFCACEGVKTLESKLHHERLAQIEIALGRHLRKQDLPCVLTSDLLIRNVPLREGVAPDIAIWPGRHVLRPDVDYGSVPLSAELRPSLVLEVTSESTVEADRDTKYEIYRLAQIAEYWLYDPMGYAGGPPLRGWRLAGTTYASIAGRPGTVADRKVMLYPSRVLETAWGLEHEIELRLLDPTRGEWYRMTLEELEQDEIRADQAETRAEQAETRAEQAESRIQQEKVRSQQQQDLLRQEIQRLNALLDKRAGQD